MAVSRGGFIMILPAGAESWTDERRRRYEKCYVCGGKCGLTGRSVKRLGRVCGKCYDEIIDSGIDTLLSHVHDPFFNVVDISFRARYDLPLIKEG